MDEATNVAVEALWQTCLAFARQLEELHPGIAAAAHDDLVSEASASDVVRLRGRQEAEFLSRAVRYAAGRVGEIAVISRGRRRGKKHG